MRLHGVSPSTLSMVQEEVERQRVLDRSVFRVARDGLDQRVDTTRRSRLLRRARCDRGGGRPRASVRSRHWAHGRSEHPGPWYGARALGDEDAPPTSSSHSPTPAVIVSSKCSSGESSSARAAAMPPCAHRVEPSLTWALVIEQHGASCTSRMQGCGEPATPEPTTMTSARTVQPGAGSGKLHRQRAHDAGPMLHGGLSMGRVSRAWPRPAPRRCRDCGIINGVNRAAFNIEQHVVVWNWNEWIKCVLLVVS